MKWGFPFFTHQGLMCSMAAFKNHCAFGFWRATLIFGAGKSAPGVGEKAMGQFGRITSLSDLPPDDVLTGYVKKAAALNERGTERQPRPKQKEKKDLVVPAFFAAALKKNKKALATFEAYSYSHKREYVQWVAEAKREETRQRRLATAVARLAKGKGSSPHSGSE